MAKRASKTTSKRTTAKIKASNKAFASATPAKKRVMIAEDVLKMLATKKFTACQGTYAHIDGPRSVVTEKDIASDVDLRDIIRKPNVRCQVCALGITFLALVDREDKLPISELGFYQAGSAGVDGGNVKDYLEDLFTRDQQYLVESAFEIREMGNSGTTRAARNIVEDAISFGRRFHHSETRLRGIMENITKHKGTFVPSDMPKELVVD